MFQFPKIYFSVPQQEITDFHDHATSKWQEDRGSGKKLVGLALSSWIQGLTKLSSALELMESSHYFLLLPSSLSQDFPWSGPQKSRGEKGLGLLHSLRTLGVFSFPLLKPELVGFSLSSFYLHFTAFSGFGLL